MNLSLDQKVRDLIVSQLTLFNNIFESKKSEDRNDKGWSVSITNNNLIQSLLELSIDFRLKDKIQIIDDGIFSQILDNQNKTFLNLSLFKRDELILSLMNNFNFAFLCNEFVDDEMRKRLLRGNQEMIVYLNKLQPIFWNLNKDLRTEGVPVPIGSNVFEQATSGAKSPRQISDIDQILKQKFNDQQVKFERSVDEKLKGLENRFYTNLNSIRTNVYNMYRATGNLSITIDNILKFLDSKQGIRTQWFNCTTSRFYFNIVPKYKITGSDLEYLRFDIVCDDLSDNKIKWTLEVEIRLLSDTSTTGTILKYDAQKSNDKISRLVKYRDLSNFIKNDSLKLDIFYKRGEIICFVP